MTSPPPIDEETSPSLRAYYEAVLAMLGRIAREEKGPQAGIERTSDIVQEVFLRIGPQLKRRETVESLVPLAATIARRWLIDRTRRRSHTVPIPDAVPEGLIAGAERSLRGIGIDPLDLADFLRQLEPRNRTVLDLRIFAGLDLHEIERVTGETEYFVRQTLKRARRELLRE